jgi:hypothetical protein
MQRAILLATETIGERFCCCQEKKDFSKKAATLEEDRSPQIGGRARLERALLPPVYRM